MMKPLTEYQLRVFGHLYRNKQGASLRSIAIFLLDGARELDKMYRDSVQGAMSRLCTTRPELITKTKTDDVTDPYIYRLTRQGFEFYLWHILDQAAVKFGGRTTYDGVYVVLHLSDIQRLAWGKIVGSSVSLYCLSDGAVRVSRISVDQDASDWDHPCFDDDGDNVCLDSTEIERLRQVLSQGEVEPFYLGLIHLIGSGATV